MAIRDLAAEVERLEPLAALGQAVCDMPVDARLHHEGRAGGEWLALRRSDRLTFFFYYADTAKAALDKAEKGPWGRRI